MRRRRTNLKKEKSPWWKSQYLDPVIVETIFSWRTNTEAEVDEILKNMKLPLGAHVLDLACGQGRHSIELAKRGFKVTGLDYSPMLLKRAAASAKKLPKSIRPRFV